MKDPLGYALLQREARDPTELAAWVERWRAGEPAQYVAGALYFRGRRFASDRRAYITDPELTHLIDAVLQVGDAFEGRRGRAPRLLEFGVGAGSLAITLKLERPHWVVHGLDIDGAALQLARENAARHGVEIELCCSDLLQDWSGVTPEIVFGDPPWGGADDLYDAERDARYYAQMPAASAFPVEGLVTALHDRLLNAIAARRWSSLVVLNYGVLAPATIARSAECLGAYRIEQPDPRVRLLLGSAQPEAWPELRA